MPDLPHLIPLELDGIPGTDVRNVHMQITAPTEETGWVPGGEMRATIVAVETGEVELMEYGNDHPVATHPQYVDAVDVHPYLFDLVARLEYAPRRTVKILQDSKSLWHLEVQLDVEDTYAKVKPYESMIVHHMIPIPPPSMTDDHGPDAYEWWMRWLLDALIAVEAHEAREWFKIDGKRPFDPHHPRGAQYEMVRVPMP